MKRKIGIAIAIGLMFVALHGSYQVTAQPWPPHTVAGFVRPSFEANYSNAVMYLITNTSGPLIIQNKLDPGSAPDFYPSYAQDIGSMNYDWSAIDQVVVILETRRGMNGWNNINYTTSSFAQVNFTEPQELPEVQLEQYPSVTVALTGSDTANISWTGMTDSFNNIVGYQVYRATNPPASTPWQGSFVAISGAVVPQATGTRYYDDVSLATGTYCYKLSVLYRRDVAGTMTNSTIGLSEWGPSTCLTITVPPQIDNTYPAHNDFDIPQAANIVVTFNKAMDSTVGQYSVNIDPAVALTPGWTVGDTVLTLTHATPFAICTAYTVKVAANDTFGNPLVAGPVPNPWTFNSICPNPQVNLTIPANGATGVDRNADIVIGFTKAMDTTTGQYSVNINPAVGFTDTWSVGDMRLTLTLTAPLQLGTAYTVTVRANDTASNPLSPNPSVFSFTSNDLPTVTVTAPTAGCYLGGSTININWTMTDETPQANLVADLTYTSSDGSGAITTLTGQLGYAWTAPSIDATDVEVMVEVTDALGEAGNDTSALFEIDSTPPTISTYGPTGTGVQLDALVFLEFSETMDTSSVEGAVTIAPAVTGISYAWSNNDQRVDISHAAFQTFTTYWVNTSIDATCDCGPGDNLTTGHTFSFTTGGKTPKAPVLNDPTGITDTKLTLSWAAVTQYTDDTTIPGTVTVNYRIFRDGNQIAEVTTTSYEDTTLTPNTQYTYYVRAVAEGMVSANSNTRTVTTLEQVVDGDLTWLWILIIIIIIVIVILIVALMMRKKKPEVEEMPPEEEVPLEEAPIEEMPPEEVPMEEAPPEEVPLEGETPPKEQVPPGEGGEGSGETPPPA